MSPVVQKKAPREPLPARVWLAALSILCVLLMLITYATGALVNPLNTAVGTLFVPFQKGISQAGEWLSGRSDELVQIRTLLEENEALQEQVAALTEENTLLQQEKYELTRLRALLELDETYSAYNKTAARIISKDSGNWYASFLINKGTEDGLSVDMNVIADGGLVGRITSIGPNWARVTSIIADDSNVSAKTLAGNDHLIVLGGLTLMADNLLSYSQLSDEADTVVVGDKVVTSDISDKYLPGILIGYIASIEKDNNNLTKSGTLTPAVDFTHLSEVLVITDLKQSVTED